MLKYLSDTTGDEYDTIIYKAMNEFYYCKIMKDFSTYTNWLKERINFNKGEEDGISYEDKG